MKLPDACSSFLRDLESRNLRQSSIRNYRQVLEQLRSLADARDIADVSGFDAALLREWRESWTVKPGTHQLRLVLLKAFFGFAVEAGWIKQSPAAKLKPPKNDAPPTMPLGRDEMRALFAAAGGATRERALLMLMRYSGLAIQDAATLRREALDHQLLTVRRAKSGELVICELPRPVAEEVDAVGRDQRHFFWTGTSSPESVAKYWRNRFSQIARRAGVSDFRTHRLRDTFAVELLLADVSIEDVSVLLGHSSVKTTERYYAPWDKSRRDRLTRVVRDAHKRDPLLPEWYPVPDERTGRGCTNSPGPRLGKSFQIPPERAVQ